MVQPFFGPLNCLYYSNCHTTKLLEQRSFSSNSLVLFGSKWQMPGVTIFLQGQFSVIQYINILTGHKDMKWYLNR